MNWMGFSEQINVSNVLLLPSRARTAPREAAAVLQSSAALKCVQSVACAAPAWVSAARKAACLHSAVRAPTAHEKTAHQW